MYFVIVTPGPGMSAPRLHAMSRVEGAACPVRRGSVQELKMSRPFGMLALLSVATSAATRVTAPFHHFHFERLRAVRCDL